nr:hypothetical protein F511_32597 [Ipomoea batatas]
MNSRFTPTRQHPQTDLNHIHHRKHQEQAPHHRPNRRSHHPKPQNLRVHMRPKRLIRFLAVQQINRQFQPLSHQGREQEKAERHDLENQKFLHHIDPRVAVRALFQAFLPRSRQGQPHEHRDGEEGVHVHQPVQRRHVDARGGRRRRRGGAASSGLRGGVIRLKANPRSEILIASRVLMYWIDAKGKKVREEGSRISWSERNTEGLN